MTAGDCNQTNLKKVLPTFYRYVTVPTKVDNILDHVYTNAQGAYRVPHLGSSESDHSSVMLVPSYQPLQKQEKSKSSEDGQREPYQLWWTVFLFFFFLHQLVCSKRLPHLMV